MSRPVVFALLAVSVVILGLNWPIMTITLRSITPIWTAAFRVGVAAAGVTLVAALRRDLVVPSRRDLPIVVSVSLFRLATVMTLVFFALQLVPTGRAAVLVWTTSLWTVPFAAVFLGERMTSRKWLGLVIGISGVFVLSEVWGNDWQNPSVIAGTGLLIAAALVNASTAVHIRRHRWTIKPLQALPWQLAGATIVLVVLGFVVDGPPNIEWDSQLIAMMAYQALLASGLAFWAQIVVLRNFSAVSTNLTMTGVPVMGVVSSALVLREPITLTLTLGMLLVIAGVVVNLTSGERPDGFDSIA